MVTSDAKVQTAVHSLDQGRLGTLIEVAMFGALIGCLSLLYLCVQFRGLSTAAAMDLAQISRRLADGKGFTTDYIRPPVLSIIQRQTLITRPPQVRGFPGTAFIPFPIDGQRIIFSDRPRWNQARAAVP